MYGVVNSDLLEGFNGQIALTGDAIVILRRGWIAQQNYPQAAQLIIPIASIVGVRWKPCGWLSPGFIHFDSGDIDGRAYPLRRHPRIVIFQKSQAKAFEMLRDDLEAAQRRLSSMPVRGRPMGVADELSKLSRLVDRGLLTATEYERQKAKLLGS